VHTDTQLKRFWKIQRDTQERNLTVEQVIQKINERQNDYIKYILPQKEHANIVIYYSCASSKLEDISYRLSDSDLDVCLEIKNEIITFCYSILSPFSTKIESISSTDTTRFTIKNDITLEKIYGVFEDEGLVFSKSSIVKGHIGVIQLLILRLLIHSLNDT
jgi:hypothetical protein